MSTDQPRRAICEQCGARAWIPATEQRVCGECGGQFRQMGPLESLVERWFAPPPQRISVFYPRHLKLIELLWTADDRGRETYEALRPPVSYSRFVTRATEVVVRGLEEGWIQAQIPAAPVDDDSAYGLRFLDPDRWAEELTLEFIDSREGQASGREPLQLPESF